MTTTFDNSSYRDADVGEAFEISPQVNSRYMRTTYSRLIMVSDLINFNTSIFAGMHKRNRSLGSVQAFICEIALATPSFVDENIKPFCIGNGTSLMLGTDYMDTLYFDRLAAYQAKQKKAKTPPSPIAKPQPVQTQNTFQDLTAKRLSF